MTVVWLIVLVLSLLFVAVAFGSAILRFFASVAIAVSTPVREVIKLYKSNQKKKARALLASFSFAITSLALLVWLLIATS